MMAARINIYFLRYVLLYQLSVLKEKVMGKFISQARKKFIHEHGSLSCKSEHQCSFLLPDGRQYMFSAFFGTHHFSFIHRCVAMCGRIFI